MSFLIVYDSQSEKFLSKCDKHIADRIITKIETILPNNPVPQNATSIIGGHGVFRIRVGDYRVLYRIDYPKNRIVILKVDKRSIVYDR